MSDGQTQRQLDGGGERGEKEVLRKAEHSPKRSAEQPAVKSIDIRRYPSAAQSEAVGAERTRSEEAKSDGAISLPSEGGIKLAVSGASR